MLCSVIIPLYNKAAYVEATLASVLAQTHADWEVLVVDDGSSDDGAQRVLACPDARVRLIRQANGGVSRARNHGIAEARGELVCFLDADDLYAPDYLRTQVGLAQAFPADSFFATGYTSFAPGSAPDMAAAPVAPAQAQCIDAFFTYYNHHWPFFCTNSVAVRRWLRCNRAFRKASSLAKTWTCGFAWPSSIAWCWRRRPWWPTGAKWAAV